jgi:hypothetical protein
MNIPINYVGTLILIWKLQNIFWAEICKSCMTEKFNEKEVSVQVQCVFNRSIKMCRNNDNDDNNKNNNNILQNVYKM